MFVVLHNATPANGLIPSGLGVPLVDNAGLILGEVDGATMYIYRPFLTQASPAEVEAFARFLTMARDELLIERSALVDSAQNDRFAQACAAQVRAFAKKPTDSAALVKSLASTEKAYKELIRDTGVALAEVVRLSNAPEAMFGKEFDDLLRIAKVRSVKVTNSQILVDTNTIFCRNPSTNILHRLGEYTIVLHFNGAVQFLNKIGPVNLGDRIRMHAPHVNAEGNPCLGNTKDQFPELIRGRQYASAVQLAILFLESVNINDNWGRTLARFPVATEQA
jgi:hypothetical protein